MIDWSKIEVESAGRRGEYIVWDRFNDLAILEIRAKDRETGKVQKIEARDLRGYPPETISTTVASLDNPNTVTKLTAWAIETVESMVCERCRDNWGPVCKTCMEETGDDLFLALRQIERIGNGEHQES